MKKIFSHGAFAAMALLLASSCMVRDYAEYYHTDQFMLDICREVIENTVEYSISQFAALQENGNDINADGFTASISNKSDGMNLGITRTEDNVWSVKGTSSDTEFSMTATRTLDAGEPYDAVWTCSECNITYTEGDGYTLNITASNSSEFSWSRSLNVSNVSYSYTLNHTGAYNFATYDGSKALDYGTVKYQLIGVSIEVTHNH